jgi:hypothetical protein
MRHVICALGMLLCAILPALSWAELTVILKFDSGHSPGSVSAMEAEAERLLQDSGITLDWRLLDNLSSGDSFSKLALVEMKGRCEMTPFLDAAVEPPPQLGITYRIDGRVVPFSQIECDKVRSMMGEVHLPPDPRMREFLYGRALGRVLAHELIHVIKGSGQHTRDGFTRKYLSAARLTDDAID